MVKNSILGFLGALGLIIGKFLDLTDTPGGSFFLGFSVGMYLILLYNLIEKFKSKRKQEIIKT